MINPNDFIITRKRKKYKFAKFANSSLCFEYEDWDKQPVDYLEIGAGTGLFSVELATRYPEKRFVAVDVKADRLQKGAGEAEQRGLSNIQFLRVRADQISDCFETGQTSIIWLTFPDPFPRTRSQRRRMTHPLYLALYRQLLRADGSLLLKHDNPDFFAWSLEQLVGECWRITLLSFDLHGSELSQEYKTMTTYEQRWISEGRITHFVRATPERLSSTHCDKVDS